MTVTVLFLLVLALAVGTAFFGAQAAGARAIVDWVLSGYLIVFALIVLLILSLSLFGAVSRIALLVGLTVACFVSVAASRRRPRSIAVWHGVYRAAGPAVRSQPLLGVLLAVVTGVLGYSAALVVGTPPNSWDSLSYHLARVAFWLQDGSVGYIANVYDARLNGNPPNGEIGQLFVLGTTGSERLTGFVQLSAALVCAVGVFGIARRVGRTRPEAAFGAMIFLTLPVVLLQSSTTQNDLIVASFLVIATFFLLGRTRRDFAFAGVAVALAVGTKLTAVYALPILLALALTARPTRSRLARVLATALGAVCGSYWYVVNLGETGRIFGNLADATASMTLFELRRNVTTAFNLVLDSIDLSGVETADILVYPIVAGAAGLWVAATRRQRSPVERIRAGAVVFAMGAVPFALLTVGNGLWRFYAKLVNTWNGPSFPFDNAQHYPSGVASTRVPKFGP